MVPSLFKPMKFYCIMWCFLTFQMDTVVNPLKTSVKTVGHAVKHFPDGLRSLSHDGMSRLRGVRIHSNLFMLF